MPVTIARPSPQTPIVKLRERRVRRGEIRDRGRRLRIELVNNMPDAAVFSTQRQFIRLLEAGAQAFDVTLGFMTLASIERSDEAKRDMAGLYRAASHLAAAAPDAVIVTGAEPRAAELSDEPYWDELTKVFAAARASAHATLASCLAAHALTLYLDGVRRHRSPRKWSGLYPTEIVAAHPLTEGLSPGQSPHSRWNGLDEGELTARGYIVLTRAGEAGIDMFAKDDDHLTLFFQGHPEYDSDTLAREFRRDVARSLAGAPAPHPPANYYSAEAEARLRAHVAGMIAGAEAPHLPQYAMTGPAATWRGRGAKVVGNWLNAVAAKKIAATNPAFLRSRCGG